MYKVSNTVTRGADVQNITSEVIGTNSKAKLFRQKFTIKAKPSEIKDKLIEIESADSSLKLTDANTSIRLVVSEDGTKISEKDNTSYKVEYDNTTTNPKLKFTIDPVIAKDQAEKDKKTYILLVDMPYKDANKVGAKITYNGETVNRYLSQFTETTDLVVMDACEGKYLARDINLITTDIANIKKPDIYFEKVDADEKDTKLKGAEFELHRKFDDGYAAVKKDGTKDTALTKKWTETSDANGKFSFKGIPSDGDYKVVETKAPDGYSLITKDVYYFKVVNGKITGKVKADDNYSELTDNKADNPIQITNKKAQYPSTGGPGTWLGFTIIGAILMSLGAIYLALKKKQQLNQANPKT